MWVWAFSWLLGSVYHPQSACRSPWCWKIQRKAAGSDLLQYHTLQSLNWKQVQWGNCTGVFWQKIHWIGLSCRGCTDKTNTWDVNASTSGVQSQGESAPQLPRRQNFTDSAWKPTGGTSKVDSHCNYCSKDKAAARKELTRRDQSCGNITESQRSDHAPTPRLNS